jgi:hypothetical protein
MTNQVTPTSIRVGYAVLMVVILSGIVGLVWPDRPSWVLWAETGLILAVLAFFVYKKLRMGRPPGAKQRPVQMVTVYAAVMVYAWGSTAAVWKLPDSPWWISGSMAVLLIAGIWVWAYRATRKKV